MYKSIKKEIIELPTLNYKKLARFNFFVTITAIIECSQLFILAKPAYSYCKAGVFVNIFEGSWNCAKHQIEGEIKKAGIDIVNPNYLSAYAAFNTLKQTGVMKSGGQCYAAVEVAKTGGAIAASAYGIPPKLAGLITAIAGADANKACDSTFGKPSSEEVSFALNTPGTGGIKDPALAQAQFEAGVKIANLQANAKIKEAQIIADALQRQTEAQEKGKTERVKIETETLLALTKANNEIQLREIDLNAALKRRELTNNLISQGIESILKYFLSKAELDKEREITKREIELKKIELEMAKVNHSPTSKPQLDIELSSSNPEKQAYPPVQPTVPVQNLSGSAICSKSDLTTVIQQGQYRAVLFQWNTHFFGGNYTPSKRCEIVSDKLDSLIKANDGQFSGIRFIPGLVNNYPVICSPKTGESSCNPQNILFTLKPENRAKANEIVLSLKDPNTYGSFSINEARRPEADLGEWAKRNLNLNSTYPQNNSQPVRLPRFR